MCIVKINTSLTANLQTYNRLHRGVFQFAIFWLYNDCVMTMQPWRSSNIRAIHWLGLKWSPILVLYPKLGGKSMPHKRRCELDVELGKLDDKNDTVTLNRQLKPFQG